MNEDYTIASMSLLDEGICIMKNGSDFLGDVISEREIQMYKLVIVFGAVLFKVGQKGRMSFRNYDLGRG